MPPAPSGSPELPPLPPADPESAIDPDWDLGRAAKRYREEVGRVLAERHAAGDSGIGNYRYEILNFGAEL